MSGLLPDSTFVPPREKPDSGLGDKVLLVKLQHGGTETYAVGGWNQYTLEAIGAAVVFRSDGTRKVYAAGVWETIETVSS